jgi:hypothetical protein
MASDDQMYESALRNARQVATVCDAIYERWEREVMALPARKRKNWGGRIFDKNGCLVTVRYAPRPAGCDQHTLFAERITARSAAERQLPEGTWIPVQSVSIRAAKVALCREHGMEFMTADVGTRRCEVPTVDNETHIARAVAGMAARHTGNHRPRVHSVRIPTAAGQPVRG